MMKINQNQNLRFQKILNDLKRRPEDAAKDLNINLSEIHKILDCEIQLSDEIIKKAVEVWPVNIADFHVIEDDAEAGFKILREKESDKTKRLMTRGNKPYYLYKDTVMSKLSPFRPEWIREEAVVLDDNPDNLDVKYNNGHFLHQFTYFIGPVNFYYILDGKKKVAKMNTGDSMYIAPYIPHSFTTRKNKENIKGLILALTYTDKITTECLNEMNAIGVEKIKKMRMTLNNQKNAILSSIHYFLNISSLSEKNLTDIYELNINDIFDDKNKINYKLLDKIADILEVNIKDILAPAKSCDVKILLNKNAKKWYYPNSEKKFFKFTQLTCTKDLPCSKSFEMEILRKNNDVTFEVPSHQYIYNISNDICEIDFEEQIIKLNPGDSLYIKPNKKHKYNEIAKLLVLRIAGRVSGDVVYHLSNLSEKNFKRLIKDEMQWFN